MSDNYRADTLARLDSTLIATVPKDPETLNNITEFKYMFYKTIKDEGYTGDASGLFDTLINILNGEGIEITASSGIKFYDSKEDFPDEGVKDKIYIDGSSNTPYYWDTKTQAYIAFMPQDISDHINNKNIHFEKEGSLSDVIEEIKNQINNIPGEEEFNEVKDDIDSIKNELDKKASIEDVKYLEKEQEKLDGKIDKVQDAVDEAEDRIEEVYNLFLEHIENKNIHLTEAEKQALASILGLKYDPNGELLKFKYLEV